MKTGSRWMCDQASWVSLGYGSAAPWQVAEEVPVDRAVTDAKREMDKKEKGGLVKVMSWLPVVPPILGAVAAFMLNRGNRVRRARSAALDDLLLHERAATLLQDSQHLIDQLAAHARESVRTYDVTRVAAGKKREAWVARATVAGLAVLMGVPAIAFEIDSTGH